MKIYSIKEIKDAKLPSYDDIEEKIEDYYGYDFQLKGVIGDILYDYIHTKNETNIKDDWYEKVFDELDFDDLRNENLEDLIKSIIGKLPENDEDSDN